MTIKSSGKIGIANIKGEFAPGVITLPPGEIAGTGPTWYLYGPGYLVLSPADIGRTILESGGNRTGVITNYEDYQVFVRGDYEDYYRVTFTMAGGTPTSGSDWKVLPAGSNSLSNYYAGGSYVPAGTIGYPGGVATYIPSSGRINLSNFYGASDEWRTNFYMFGIYETSGGLADDNYFGGDIPREFAFINRNSNDYYSFTVPSGYNNVVLSASAWQVQLACGYSWYDPGPYDGTDYYYDYQRYFGIMVYDVTGGGAVGYIRNTTDVNSYTGTFNTYNVPSGLVSLSAGRTYRVYYSCDFRRDSDPGYGNNSFGWYNNSTPLITVVAT
jgi:hypothetical protein